MTTSIYFDCMTGVYAVERDGEFVGVGSTYHDAEIIGLSMNEAHYSAIIGGDPLLIEAHRFAERGSICAACEDQAQPCAVCDDAKRCDCGALAAWEAPFADEPHYQYFCDACWPATHYRGTRIADDIPLMAQCAAAIDSCLGGPVANGGILDELRRVRAELKKAGW